MATFGHYEAGRVLHRTRFSAIYLLSSADEGGPQRVIKAYRPFVRVHDEMLEAIQSQAFLGSAAVQQKTARLNAKCWAPIYEFGTASSGPFYVTDRYDFSIRQLVDCHVKLGVTGIHNITCSIVCGLLALKQACGRPHGNLKLTNILIAGRGDVAKATVVLCDPLPDCQPHAHADLRRLGEIIYELVVHHSVPRVAGYQLPESEHWRKLGRQGEAWRQVCNRLLQADVESATITLEELTDQLATMAPRSSRRAFVIAIGIGVIIGLGILCWLLSRIIWDVLHRDGTGS